MTVTSEVTVTLAPPTQTPIPTPTFHPDFIALQNLISDSSENVTLLPDGTIEENGVVIPNLHVDQNGVINLIVNNENIVIEPSLINFDDENGLIIDAYILTPDGNWRPVISEAIQTTTGLIEQYAINPESVTIAEAEGVVTVTDNETGKVMMETTPVPEGTLRDHYGLVRTLYGLEFAVDGIAAKSCEPTDFRPSKNGLMLAENVGISEYVTKLLDEPINNSGGGFFHHILLDRDKQCWGIAVKGRDLYYRNGEGVAQKLPLIEMTKEEVEAFQVTR